MLVFKEVEKCLNDNGFKIVREVGKYWYSNSDWKIIFEHPIIRFGQFTVGNFSDNEIVTINGIQYIKSLEFAHEISTDQADKYISSYDWQRKTHAYFMFLFRWQVKKIKRKIDDCISHLAFLQQRSKQEEITGKIADVNKDFQ